ncbi:MAG: leucine-rich repeat domain-containing protein [Promethearchaeota archaeon]
MNLRAINLYDNRLGKLPESFEKLKDLKSLDLSYNMFSEFPKAIFKLKKLEDLYSL